MDFALFLRNHDNNHKQYLTSGTNVTLMSKDRINVDCEFRMYNIFPNVVLALGDHKNPYIKNVNRDFYYVEKTIRQENPGGLIQQEIFMHYKNRYRYPKLEYHRKRFTCLTEFKSWKRTEDLWVNIFIHGKIE